MGGPVALTCDVPDGDDALGLPAFDVGMSEALDGVYFEFGAVEKLGLGAAAMGAGPAMGNGFVRLAAAVADAHSFDLENLKLRIFEQVAVLRRPKPGVFEEISYDPRHLAKADRHFRYARQAVFPRRVPEKVNHMKHNAQFVHDSLITCRRRIGESPLAVMQPILQEKLRCSSPGV